MLCSTFRTPCSVGMKYIVFFYPFVFAVPNWDMRRGLTSQLGTEAHQAGVSGLSLNQGKGISSAGEMEEANTICSVIYQRCM